MIFKISMESKVNYGLKRLKYQWKLVVCFESEGILYTREGFDSFLLGGRGFGDFGQGRFEVITLGFDKVLIA